MFVQHIDFIFFIQFSRQAAPAFHQEIRPSGPCGNLLPHFVSIWEYRSRGVRLLRRASMYSIGIDIGGTFTDAAVVEHGQDRRTAKTDPIDRAPERVAKNLWEGAISDDDDATAERHAAIRRERLRGGNPAENEGLHRSRGRAPGDGRSLAERGKSVHLKMRGDVRRVIRRAEIISEAPVLPLLRNPARSARRDNRRATPRLAPAHLRIACAPENFFRNP